MRLGKKLKNRRKNEAKVKDQSTFLKPNNFKSLKKSLAYNEIILDKIKKVIMKLMGLVFA